MLAEPFIVVMGRLAHVAIPLKLGSARASAAIRISPPSPPNYSYFVLDKLARFR